MLPEAEYFRPGDDVSWLVRQFEVIRYCSNIEITDKFVPREDAAIVFHFRNRPRMLSPVNQVLPPFFIAPVSPKANSISLTGDNDSLIVICKPTVLSRILNISLAAGNKIYLPLPDNPFRSVLEKMREEAKTEDRIAVFTSFVNDMCPEGYTPDETDKIYEYITGKGVSASINDILSGLSVSERTTQRRFRHRLGVSPKKLVRIMRINHIWEAISGGDKIDYQDLVVLGRYYDQTHMIKDFKSITGETPDAFFRRKPDVARIFSGK